MTVGSAAVFPDDDIATDASNVELVLDTLAAVSFREDDFHRRFRRVVAKTGNWSTPGFLMLIFLPVVHSSDATELTDDAAMDALSHSSSNS